MLQIRNLDETKTDWINETQIIIPMIDGEDLQTKDIDRLSKSTITLNGIDGTDQTLLANATGHAFVIGLEKSLFENDGCKSDLLLMQNSDLKLLPTVPDSKLTYGLPSVDETKNDIIWENSNFEKPLSKDILNVIQESSKNWNDLGKGSEICLEDIGADNKLSSDFLIEPDLVGQSKRMRNDGNDQQCIVGYYPVVETCDAVLVPASLMTLQEKAMIIGNEVINSTTNFNQFFMNDTVEDAQSTKWMKSLETSTVQAQDNFISNKISNENQESILKMSNTQKNELILTQQDVDLNNKTVIPLIESVSHDFIETKSNNDIIDSELEKCIAKVEKCDGKVEAPDNTLSEQNLPLKKKAKMKKSPVNGICNFTVIDNLQIAKPNDVSLFENEADVFETQSKTAISGFVDNCENHSESNYDSDEPLSDRVKRKHENLNYNFKKKKKKCEGIAPKRHAPETTVVKKNVGKKTGRIRAAQSHVTAGSDRPFENISQLLEQLRNEKYINDAIYKLLLTGMEEMKVDILQEMYKNREGNGKEYSSHLKAFALMLHFKQPTAFNRLGELFKNGWPSLHIIKDWKRLLNNHRRPRI